MSGNSNTSGVTLLEVMVALAIIGLVAAIIVPNLQRLSPERKREQFITELNGLTSFAWHNAIMTNRVQRIFFDLEKKQVHIQQAEPGEKEDTFVPVHAAYRSTEYMIPQEVTIKDFYIDGVSEMHAGKTVQRIWFYIVPDGLSQAIIINALYETDDATSVLGLVLNPFSGQFKVYNEFQKP